MPRMHCQSRTDRSGMVGVRGFRESMQSRGGCWFAVVSVLQCQERPVFVSIRAGEEESGVSAGSKGS